MLSYDEREIRLGEVLQMKVRLDVDPVVNGLASINAMIATIQAYKDRVSSLVLEAIKNKHEAQRAYDEVEFTYDQSMSKMLATDPEVQNQKSEKLREATAQTKMAETVLKKHYASLELMDSESYYKQMQHAYENLEAANSGLSRQISVIQMAMQIGEINRSDLGDIFGRQISLKK